MPKKEATMKDPLVSVKTVNGVQSLRLAPKMMGNQIGNFSMARHDTKPQTNSIKQLIMFRKEPSFRQTG